MSKRGYILWNTGRQPQQKVLAVVQTRTRTGYFCLCLPLPLNSSFFYSVPFFSLSLFFCLISPWQSPVVLSPCLLDPFSYCPFTVSVTVLRSNLSSKPGTCIRQVINCTKKQKMVKQWMPILEATIACAIQYISRNAQLCAIHSKKGLL